MRLIDVHKLQKTIHLHNSQRITKSKVIEYCKEQPTVEAIPIEWLKKFANERALNDGMDCYWHFWGEDLLQMIELWEAENGDSKD